MPVIFDEDQTQYSPDPSGQKATGLTGLIISTGLASDKRRAQIILLGILALMVIIFIAMMVLGSNDQEIIFDDNIDPTTGLPFGVAPPQ